ncbi:MAG: DUF2254 domain-containing protein [Nitrosopumilus sp.]|nr:DUF2254 domain-containing protein [Nitrosopumilus sp.]
MKTSFWLLPAVMTAAAFGLSFVTLNWDNSLEGNDLYSYSVWKGGAQGARELLSTIAGSIITITGVVFSITTVSLALASNQFGSKLLPNFIRDLGTQVVLGTFIATSIYTLLILRTVKGHSTDDAGNGFIPNVSISISMGLAILSLSMLIYFIHHLSVRIQSTDIISRVAGELIQMIETNMQDQANNIEPKIVLEERECKDFVTSSKIGYLQVIDYKKLLELAKQHQFILEIDIRAGNFVRKGAILARINTILPKRIINFIVEAFVINKQRSPTQDLEYAIEQLVAIALRALSPNANDTFTTNTCVDYLGAAICLICQKDLKPFYYDKNPYIKLISHQETFDGLVDSSFNQIRQFSSGKPSVLIRILETLSYILPCTQTHEQRTALKKHACMIKNLVSNLLEEQDRIDVQKKYDQFELKFKRF